MLMSKLIIVDTKEPPNPPHPPEYPIQCYGWDRPDYPFIYIFDESSNLWIAEGTNGQIFDTYVPKNTKDSADEAYERAMSVI